MEYTLAIDDTPDTVEGGTGILLVHPSTGATDRLDTDFLSTDTDAMLVVSTRTTAREVKQKLEYYEVDEERANILDTLSVPKGRCSKLPTRKPTSGSSVYARAFAAIAGEASIP